ncbi:methylated-DNA-[protein]-cysteine S-methyltransferase [Streptomyces sp. DvalAA-14]|uniref:methylated-DNA--[protein]-cysteine S-methyltransferase n=1 Tax=unclassified Streptomyces TaxID=2593676 RepID=UPI00081BA56D|nr:MULTISPECIES: methylated-DNA--[protein]-cysteine S-methyltransferase [unclassified Streptomyces]MYS22910.1 methylated-DNA--[protein]-cysteine S-methyltransferase [Streptomyces sp. SID4948]SCE24324.1 methylated-DNA-[protein]-cysteine S-methyltransferase [Streptomyces sp. DvalAA-14]
MRTYTVVDSPVGELVVTAEDGSLVGLYFAHRHRGRPAPADFGVRDDTGFEAVRRQLAEFFAGARQTFELPLAVRGDAFEQRVWELIAAIPYGRTRTYGELADELGDRALAQAVGAAVGRNPLSLLVPCHRVVGAGGKLTGYAGGLDRKRFLLDLEEPAEQRTARLF